VTIESVWVGDPASPHPVVVFLHEGLGSVAMWRDFPDTFCRSNGLRGFVYSRAGYGRSVPETPNERWQPGYMHDEAFEALPALLTDQGIERPFLLGHSDGGSIALLHASRHPVQGVIALAPHLFVESLSVESIAKSRDAYRNGDLRERLARYHDDADAVFWRWNEVWLSPQFRGWNIEAEVVTITAPVFAIQGEDDEYGTLEQIRAIRRGLPKTRLLAVPQCGHSPHRDRPDIVIPEAGRFVLEHSPVHVSSPGDLRT